MFYLVTLFVTFLLTLSAHAHEISGMNQMNQKSVTFIAHATLGNPVVLEWEAIPGQTARLSEKIKSLAETLVAAYTKTEVEFGQKEPSLVANDFMLKSLAPLVEQRPIDWGKHSNAHDLNLFVVARNQKTGKNLGVIQFLSSPDFESNTIKAALFGVIPTANNRGIEKLLIVSIFKLRRDVHRIFLHTRSTNEQAIADYKNWGFSQFEGKLPIWTDLEYLVEQSHTLQNRAQDLSS